MNMFSYSYSQNFAPVQIIDARVNEMYASFYNCYATTPVGNVIIRNDYDEELAMNLQISVPGLTARPTQENIKIAPNSQQSFDFPVVFSNAILNKKETEFRQAKIRIDYKIKNEDQFVEASESFRLFGRGAITWDRPGKAAAFITKGDRMVALFAREATKDLAYRTELDLGNIYTAAVLFDAMSAVGIKYHQDPENLFSIIPKNQHSVDYIQYPAELLTSKQGDCDDLTVLYASLLEFSGIKTALVTTPTHITLMFDTGIHERNWGVLPLGDSLVVVKNKTLWVPVEVTEIGKPFAHAWQEGGRQFREAEKETGFQVVPVQDVEGVYLSALPEEYQARIPELPDSTLLANMFSADTTWIQQSRSQTVINSLLARLENNPEDNSLRNKLGIIYAQQNQVDNAKIHFKYMYNRNPDDFQVLVNLANIYAISGNFSEAEKYYLAAKKVNEAEPGLYLNLAILHQLWKTENPEDSTQNQIKSEKNLLQAFSLLKGDEVQSLDLLAISSEDINIGEKADFRSWVKEQAKEIKKYIKQNAKKYLFNKSVKGARLKRKAVKRGVEQERRFVLWWSWRG
jgi:tetratricopeptide (TPR) repeat protein